MTSISTKLRIFPSQNNTIFLSKKLIHQLGIKPNQKIDLFLGLKHLDVKVLEKKMNQDQTFLSSSVYKKLHLPYQKQIMIKRENNRIRIGPLIGILTTDYSGKKFTNSTSEFENPFSQFFKKLLEPEPFYPAYYFVFTPEQVDWPSRTVNGFFYLPQLKGKEWQQIRVPLPDVVYNRVPNRTTEKTPAVVQFKENYQRLGGILFNQNFFNKWEMHQILSVDDRIKKYFPETYLSSHISTLEYMLSKYPLVYLKPSEGSLGLGIYKIQKERNHYLLFYRQQNQNRAISFKNLHNLYQTILRNKHKANHYLIQQGIHLLKYQNRPVDFRVHMHKNRANKWNVVAIGAKVAGNGSVTTHIRSGGKLLDAKQFIEQQFHSDATDILERLNQAALQIAQVVEEKSTTPIGELGLDMGIDQDAQIWLFEVNSKPGRSIFKHPNLKAASHTSRRSLLEYSTYLSGF
ncbi:YheC/YheD family protein [Tepidibacillus sp. LV47]|uniref:YheC/YheD family endospore coat-associated protein n=1 Tax=Tepidibacillus sp. LV47 TaxID=3398228 RepID=UPI003AAD8C48